MRILKRIPRLLLLLLLPAVGVGIDRSGLIDYLSDPYELQYTWELIVQHLILVGVSMLGAGAVGLCIGILLTRPRFRRLTPFIMYVVGLGQTVPSLAVIALAMSFMGIGFKPAVFALFVYSILPIARNTLAGITAVPAWMVDAAKGMGMSDLRILWHVELPNAMKVILTGFRIALVMNIGTAALAFLIGAGGLGEHIFTGIDLVRADKLLAGAIPTTLLALGADYLVGLAGLLLIPKGLRLQDGGS